ncbi:hypothetical protein GCM10007860_25140 [Chitiniphilus shinanonensis]|uniref:Uncharacterized protein n=1 Tax=Chitiniphilus shinanonensis TaxID=553088 RepID=A0ABQ6BYQ1_9NEIS|nr:hypothetical protein [Chitiniphilus shinanonensis]GLS05362.1 hypothetical protein GCM10007860_25140 [Chitiniphilus shinanonensis]
MELAQALLKNNRDDLNNAMGQKLIARLKGAAFFLFLFLASFAFAENGVSPFSQKNLGRCYKSTNDFFEYVIGERALDDENISVREKEGWVWIVDRTASTNYTWYLLSRSGKNLCFEAYILFAAEVGFENKCGKRVLRAIIPQALNFPGKLMIFEMGGGGRYFSIIHCYSMALSSKGKIKNPIECDQILD